MLGIGRGFLENLDREDELLPKDYEASGDRIHTLDLNFSQRDEHVFLRNQIIIAWAIPRFDF